MNESSDFATFLAPLWRRKWLIVAVAIVVAAGTYAYYHRQPDVYSASTQLDLGGGLEAQQLASTTQSRSTLSSRALADAAALITSSTIAEAVQARLAREGAPVGGVDKVRAKAASESYLVTITTEAPSAARAVRLANDYALAYAEKQHRRYQSEVRAAIASTRRQLRRIEAAQSADTARQSAQAKPTSSSSRPTPAPVSGSAVIQAASLASKINQLESDLSISSVAQVNPAKLRSATLVSPTPRKNAIFGFVIGLLLAGCLVFAAGRLDRRVRTLAQVEQLFAARMLSALPREGAPIDYRDGQPKPAPSLLEPLRRLHTAIELSDMREPAARTSPRSILFLSADSGDGKSTLVANLALAQRDAGARVAVIEADLRRPSQAGLLAVSDAVGLAEVLAGDVPFNQALQGVGRLPSPAHEESDVIARAVATVAPPRTAGSLGVLVSGRPVANPPALLAGSAMHELLREGTADYDYVLIDSPPPLQVSDAMPLLHWVDAIVIVARLQHTREIYAQRLARLLADSSTAPVLGVVANGVPRWEIRRSGYASDYRERRWPHFS